MLLATMGRHAEAVIEGEHAGAIDPLSVSANLALGSIYHGAGMADQALAQYRKAIDLEPNAPPTATSSSPASTAPSVCSTNSTTSDAAASPSSAPQPETDAMSDAYRYGGLRGLDSWQLARARKPYRKAVLLVQLDRKDEAFPLLE